MSTGIAEGSIISEANFRGMIFPYAGLTAPTGFLLCDGSAVSRSTYADLYTLIGDNYGAGDGSTTFNIPDLRSSFMLGKGQKSTITLDFVDADVNTGTYEITVSSNDYLYTGRKVTLSNIGGALPTGLSATDYYIIRVSATSVKLATSVANANNNFPVNITSAIGGGTHTFTLESFTDRSIGDNGGFESHGEVASHRHFLSDDTLHGAGTSAGGGSGADRTGTVSISIEGSNSINHMPPYTTVNFIIKY